MIYVIEIETKIPVTNCWSSAICGVYSTLEKAKAKIPENAKYSKACSNSKTHVYLERPNRTFNIYERELDRD